MLQRNRMIRIDQNPSWVGPSEPQSHTEHRAALDATLFDTSARSPELVLELDAGELRVLQRIES